MTQTAAAHTSWKTELNETIRKYHVIALWVAVIFNMLFFVTDYFNLYDHWQQFLTFRSAVSLVCLIVVLFYKKLKIPLEVLGVIPVLLISIQNAYMWSVMDVENLQKHTFAYIAMFIGSGMFMFYHVYYSVFIVAVNIISCFIFFHFNSNLSVDVILVNGAFLTAAVAIFSILLIRMRYKLTKKEIIARYALEQSKLEIQEKNNEIIDSINYAKRIQNALIPPVRVLQKMLPNSFVLFKPKDIVSGDFYWATELTTTTGKGEEKLTLFTVADCTGHGVSGAFMSIIGLKIFNQSMQQSNVNSPAQALDYLNTEVFNVVNKHSEGDQMIRDGMDAALCAINFEALKLYYAGANNPVYIIRNKELHEIKADKKPIGSYEVDTNYTDREYQLEKGDMIYIFSDGYADQFGGPKGKKFKYAQFKEVLLEISNLSPNEQCKKLDQIFEDWRGDLEQLDDVCILGVSV